MSYFRKDFIVGVILGALLIGAYKLVWEKPETQEQDAYVSEVFEVISGPVFSYNLYRDEASDLNSCVATAFAMASTLVSENKIEFHCCVNPDAKNLRKPTEVVGVFSTSPRDNQLANGLFFDSSELEPTHCTASMRMDCVWSELPDLAKETTGSISCVDPSNQSSFKTDFP